MSCIPRGQKITEQVVIGTHGKLKNWLSKRILDVSGIKILVFDEADQMLQVGHLPASCCRSSTFGQSAVFVVDTHTA